MAKHLIAVVVFLVAARSAEARPWFFILDPSKPEQHPDRFGYHVEAFLCADSVDFTVTLDRRASKAFANASVFLFYPRDPPRKIHVAVTVRKDRSKQVRFSVPKQEIRHCLLHINSAPLRSDHGLNNFAGYRLLIAGIAARPCPRRHAATRFSVLWHRFSSGFCACPSLRAEQTSFLRSGPLSGAASSMPSTPRLRSTWWRCVEAVVAPRRPSLDVADARRQRRSAGTASPSRAIRCRPRRDPTPTTAAA